MGLRASKDEDQVNILAEIRTLLAEERTAMALLRTGIAICMVPLSIFTALIATSGIYDIRKVLHLFMTVILICALFLTLGMYFNVQAIRRLRQCRARVQLIEKQHGPVYNFEGKHNPLYNKRSIERTPKNK